jgi:hypothetical protein
LDAAGTQAAFEALTQEVNASEASTGKPPKSVDEVAMGFIRVANEAMCRPIRWERAPLECILDGGGGLLCAALYAVGTQVSLRSYCALPAPEKNTTHSLGSTVAVVRKAHAFCPRAARCLLAYFLLLKCRLPQVCLVCFLSKCPACCLVNEPPCCIVLGCVVCCGVQGADTDEGV